jgi:uncharacterized membrane protein YeiH
VITALEAAKSKFYWAHSLVLVILTGFGGAFVAPMMLGKPPIPIANDIVVPIVILIWYVRLKCRVIC